MIVRPKQITQEGASVGDALVWNGAQWAPGSPILNDDMGALYISSPASKAVTSGTPTIINGTTTSIKTKNFTHAQKRLTYNGSVNKTFELIAAISAQSDTANIVLSFYFAKNGSIIAASEITRKIGTANDVGAAALAYADDLSQDDFIEIYIDIDSGSANVTIDKLILLIAEI